MSAVEYLVEVCLVVDAAGTTENFYFSTHGRTTRPFDDPANKTYLPRIVHPGAISLSMFAPGKTYGSTKYGYGAIVLSNLDGALDALTGYGFAGQRVQILRGTVAIQRPAFEVVFSGLMEQPAFEWKSLILRIRDFQYQLEKTPTQSSVYAGTNTGAPLAGIEGASELAGRRKPNIFGKVSNVSLKNVNTDRYIFQASSIGLFSIDAAYDNGKQLTAGAPYSSQAEMEATAPAVGGYRAWLGGGCIRLGSKPAGQVTADAAQGASASQRTCAQLLKIIALSAGLPAEQISEEDVAALDVLCPQELGLFVAENALTLDLMDQLAGSVGAYFGFDKDRLLRMGRLEEPSGEPLVLLSASNIISIEKLVTTDEGAGVPAWRVAVRYWRNNTIQNSALDASVSTARLAYLQQSGLVASASDAAIKTKHVLATELQFNTLLVNATDAQVEAQRRLDLYKNPRDRLKVEAYLPSVAILNIGDVVQITLPRYSMQDGRLFLLLGMIFDLSKNTVTMDLWG